jgi:hypothetical protein
MKHYRFTYCRVNPRTYTIDRGLYSCTIRATSRYHAVDLAWAICPAGCQVDTFPPQDE